MEPPFAYGNFDIARRLKRGRMVTAVHGDSIYNNTFGPYLLRFLRYGGGLIGAGGPSMLYRDLLTGWNSDGGAYAGSGDTRPWMFSPSAGGYGKIINGVGTSGADSSPLALTFTWGIASCDDAPATVAAYGYRNQAWYQNKALTYSILWYNEADGWTTFGMRATNTYGYTTFGTNAGLSAAGTPGTFSSSSIAIASQAYSGTGYAPRVHAVGTASTNYTGKKLRLVAGRIFETAKLTSGSGFAWFPMTQGGTKMQDWADLANWDQYSRTQYYNFMGVDTVWIALGQNDNARTKAQYKADANAMIDACRAANPNMQIILISPYQSDNTTYFTSTPCSDFAAALYEITTERSAYTLFLDLGGALSVGTSSAAEAWGLFKGTGPAANLSSLATDTVHPTDAGKVFLASTIAGLIDAADASAKHVTYSYTSGSALKSRNRR